VASFHFSHAVLIAVGAFYTFAGFVGIRAALQSRLIDVAIAGISMDKPPAAETGRGLWLLVGAFIVLAGGLFLILRLEWAAAAFAMSALGQAFYLLVLAPLVFDRDDPPDVKGRQQTINAFILYCAATLFVLWAYRTGKLMPAYATGWPAVYGALAILAAAFAWGLFRFYFPLAKGPLASFERDKGGADAGGAAGGVPDYDTEDETGPPLSESRRILVMSEYECDPLWTHDPGRSGTISPRELPLSDELVADFEAWAESYNGSFNMEDLNTPNWSEAHYQAHDEAGIALARRLKQELPDRQIYVWRLDNGHTEISAG
jgi:hypothetical protein